MRSANRYISDLLDRLHGTSSPTSMQVPLPLDFILSSPPHEPPRSLSHFPRPEAATICPEDDLADECPSSPPSSEPPSRYHNDDPTYDPAYEPSCDKGLKFEYKNMRHKCL
uniref:Uncharacterized protein n=2 Tax=Ixodes ricinus TaxID=34613 RepID=A0A147BGM8_IXORI